MGSQIIFPTCQVRVVRFFVSWSALLLLCRTSTASSRSECSPPDPNSKLWIKVHPRGPQLQALDRSVPRRTRTASSGSKWSPPDLNCQALDRSVPRQTSTANSGSKCSRPDLHRKLRIKAFPAKPQPRAPDRSFARRTATQPQDMPVTYARKNLKEKAR